MVCCRFRWLSILSACVTESQSLKLPSVCVSHKKERSVTCRYYRLRFDFSFRGWIENSRRVGLHSKVCLYGFDFGTFRRVSFQSGVWTLTPDLIFPGICHFGCEHRSNRSLWLWVWQGVRRLRDQSFYVCFFRCSVCWTIPFTFSKQTCGRAWRARFLFFKVDVHALWNTYALQLLPILLLQGFVIKLHDLHYHYHTHLNLELISPKRDEKWRQFK